MEPGTGRFELGGETEQETVATEARREAGADGEPIGIPDQWY